MEEKEITVGEVWESLPRLVRDDIEEHVGSILSILETLAPAEKKTAVFLIQQVMNKYLEL